MPKLSIVTTSWDDGDVKDLQVAEILRFRGLGGTFYVPITPYKGRPALDPADLRSLSSGGFEVGAHGLSHESLPRLTAHELVRDVSNCKRILEETLGEEVLMFCYPRGRYNASVVRCLRDAGYRGARTTRMLATEPNFSPFEMPTTLQAYPHSRSAYLRNLARAQRIRAFYGYVTRLIRVDSWVELGRRLFDFVLREGGIWHLYGHSWEIEKLGLWEDLRSILDYVCKREEVFYMTNRDVLALLQANTEVFREKQKA